MRFNWWTFLFEAVNFVVLAYVLHRLLYRALRDAIDKRREANAQAQADAEKARREADAARQQLREQLAAADKQRQELIQTTREQAEAERRKIMAQAEQDAAHRREEVKQLLDREREEAIKSLQNEIVSQALELTQRLLAESSERTLHEQLALRLVQTLNQLPEKELNDLRAQCRSGEAPVLDCARELDAGTLEQISAAVAGIVGKPVALAVESRPELIGGVRLQLAGHVWDSSISSHLTSANGSIGKRGES